ncbi:co-chaperone YbbN [Prevotella sp. 10(H)]|uniref:thioredoxin family protein n=1 Tax=Prevotella sp. 10(H) TaxID=1158294 RepID=UPI000689D851|nr:thioredoxin family protein [Prevotella sp. 10(H)]
MKNFRFRTWHFGLMLITLIIITNILGTQAVNSIPSRVENSRFVELNEATFNEALSSGIDFVFFHKKNSDLCNKMEYNLNKLPDESSIKYYKLNIDEYPDKGIEHQISGVPSVVIFKNGKEIERMVGVIPESNLKIIYNRITK